MARLAETASRGWYVDTADPHGKRVRKTDGDEIISAEDWKAEQEGASEKFPSSLILANVGKEAGDPDLVLESNRPWLPSPEEVNQVSFPPRTPDERQAMLNAYASLQNAGVNIPVELAAEVNYWIAEEQRINAEDKAVFEAEQKQIAEDNESGPWWVRNAYRAHFSLRLDRQEKRKRIELSPRGQRGDMHPLQDGDLDDPILQNNLNTGLIEIIPNGEAKSVLKKQTHNIQQTHTPLAILRNEKGEPYAPESVKLEAEFNSQGVTVAVEDPNIGKQHENARWRTSTGGLVRLQPGQAPPQPEVVSQHFPTGGNPAIISSGWDTNAQAKIADDVARRAKGRPGDPQGPAAGIAGLAVTIAPTERA